MSKSCDSIKVNRTKKTTHQLMIDIVHTNSATPQGEHLNHFIFPYLIVTTKRRPNYWAMEIHTSTASKVRKSFQPQRLQILFSLIVLFYSDAHVRRIQERKILLARNTTGTFDDAAWLNCGGGEAVHIGRVQHVNWFCLLQRFPIYTLCAVLALVAVCMHWLWPRPPAIVLIEAEFRLVHLKCDKLHIFSKP